ncbi:putative acetyltransferase (GNAT family) [Methanocella arvoryzae MRE50]|uniref:Acetyltransferase (GNAT family) n=2 Tax=Methanocella TaxID=570266 RepID=Q0W0Z0_METAR|nr:putative acetyltransferase (GNAT family) [Methanocella arvoryzae MRE50]
MHEPRIRTSRLELIAATVELIRAEMADRDRFSKLLQARVPGEEEDEAWPPENIRDVIGLFSAYLEREPDMAGWLNWYWVLVDDRTDRRILIGNGGFTSRPVNGTVAIGYSVLRQYQGRGYATEAVAALVQWAFEHTEVDRIIAEVVNDNVRSVRVLEKNSFHLVGKGSEEGTSRYELNRFSF